MSCFSPHLCVGFLFLVLHSRLRPSSSSRLLLLQLAHTQLVHTLVHTQLAHTHTTCPHTTCPHTTCPHTTSSHATCPHTTCPPSQLVHTQLVHLHFAWQAWHLVTATFSLRGRRGTYGMVGVALGDMDLHFAWHFCAAGVALGDIHLHFAWQARHLATSTGTLRGKAWHLVTSHLHFAWQAWHWWHWAGSGRALGSQMMPWTPQLFAWQAWHLVTSTFTLRGRRGIWRHPPSLCVAGVALGDIHLSLCVAGVAVALMALGWLCWRAWFPDDAVDAAAFCVAGVALGDIHLHFAW